jgi:hypothetical protein
MTRPACSVVAALLCAVAVPAHAEPVDAGQPCATTTTDARNAHLGHQEGFLRGGPWVVAGGRDVTITCELEFANMDCYDTPDGWRLSSTPQDTVGILGPILIEYINPYQQPIFLGTTITWTNADGTTGVHRVDADGSKPGDQCAVVTWGNEG